MNQSKRLEDYLRDARVASEHVMVERDDARQRAVRAVRYLEERLREAIAGDLLRGLSNIAGDARPELQAAHVGGKAPYGIDAFLKRDGRASTALSKDGTLVRAWIDPPLPAVSGATPVPPALHTRPLKDEEILAEDLEPITRAVQDALERHVSRADRRAASYERVSALAKRLADALGFAL